ncbi:MAG: ABC transporter permease [Ruminiclostridium sp.]|nr:ABC transporter permease [Ruminiclostridium sp.]
MKTKGWREVFSFTFVQQVKTMSFIVGTIVMSLITALITFLANFLPTLFLGDRLNDPSGSGSAVVAAVDRLYISNETGYDIDFSNIGETLGVSCEMLTADNAEAKEEELKGSAAREMLSRIVNAGGAFSINSRYAANCTTVKESDCKSLNSVLSQEVKARFLASYGIEGSALIPALSSVNTTIAKAGEKPVNEIQQIINSVVPMISSIILFVFIFAYSQLVGQAVAIEKSSRIVEYLLTSIKPLALIVGKVLAICCVSVMQFIIIILSGGIGFLISMPFGILSKISTASGETAAAMDGVINELGEAFSSFDGMVFVIMLVTFILGFLLFAGLAGLAGSSVSKMEDLAPAMQPLSIVGVLGFYLAYFPQVTGEENSFSALARYLPISSPFILPSDYMLGKIGIPEALISIAVLAVTDILLMMFVAKVYEAIILHTGNRLKVGDMLKMSK